MKIHEFDPLNAPEWTEFIRKFRSDHCVDRAGVFRYDSAAGLVQGVAGVDDDGNLENISSQLYGAQIVPGNPLQDVAQGFVPYHLTNDTGAEHPEWKVPPIRYGYAVVPIVDEDVIIGVLAADNAVSRRPFESAQVRDFIEGAREIAPSLARLEVTTASDLLPAAVDALAEGICLAGTSGWILYGNRAMSEMYGHPREVICSTHFHTLFYPFEPDGSDSAMWGEMHAREDPWTGGETMNKRADGELFPVRLRMIPLSEQTRTSCHLIVVQDLTQERELERARLREAELEGALKVVRTYNHEINNALQGLMGSMELLQMGLGERAGPVSRYLDNMNTCIDEIRECIRNMRTLTQG